MAKKKSTKKSGSSGKKSKSTLIFPLIALFVVFIVIYYILNNSLIPETDDSVKPLRKKKSLLNKQKENKEEVLADVAALEDSAEADTLIKPYKEEKVSTPKPGFTEDGKYYSVDPNLPKVCIIVDDFGYSEGQMLKNFLSLDKNIGISVIPGEQFSISTMKKAVQNGNEVLIHLPMEPESYPKDNPGDKAIFVKMTDDEINKRLDEFIYQMNLAVGINHHMGSKAAADKRIMETVMRKVKAKDLIYIDSYTNEFSVVEEMAKKYMVPFAKRNIFLDVPESSKNRALKKIEEMERIKAPVIVVITHCHNDVKYRQLKFFVEKLKDKHYQLIPPSKAGKLKKLIS